MEPHRLKDFLISQKKKDVYKKFEAAVKKGDLAEIKKLVEAGEKLLIVDYNETVMHICVHPPAKDAAIMELLIKAGGNINAVNARKETPLHYCGVYNRPDICKILLEHGADIGVIDKRKHTPYSRAQENKAEVVCTLLEAEEKKRRESKPNWEKVEVAKQFFSLRRSTITTSLSNLIKKPSKLDGTKIPEMEENEKPVDQPGEKLAPQVTTQLTEPKQNLVADKKPDEPEPKIDIPEPKITEAKQIEPEPKIAEAKPTEPEPKIDTPEPKIDIPEPKIAEVKPTEQKLEEQKELKNNDKIEEQHQPVDTLNIKSNETVPVEKPKLEENTIEPIREVEGQKPSDTPSVEQNETKPTETPTTDS